MTENNLSPTTPLTYCALVRGGTLHPVHTAYHDTEYGFPLTDDRRLFERLVLEINQAGLSWETILKRKEGFVRAYDGFDIDKVADYGDADFARLMADTGVIRNRKKIEAAIENAKRIQRLQIEFSSFAAWLDSRHPKTRVEWTTLFRQTFVFTGGEIVNEFLMSTGYLPGTHDLDCPVFAEIASLNPAWRRLY